jgi:hypothetical protein
MDVGSIASMATYMAQSRTDQAVGVAVTKLALDAQASSALALLNAIPAPPSLPSGLGQLLNTTA